MTKTVGARSQGQNCKCRAPPSWKLMGGLPVVGENVGDIFGTSVAVSGDGTTIAVGSPGVNGEVGGVYVFTYDRGNSQWKPHGQLFIGDESENYNYGRNVILSKDGSILASAGFASFGRVCVHKYDSTEIKWKPMGECFESAEASSISMSDDGETIAVGMSNVKGTTIIYKYNHGSEGWESIDEFNGENLGDQFGMSVSLSQDGKYIAIGAPGYNQRQGRVYVFHDEDGDGNWEMHTDHHFVGFDAGAEDKVGFSVSLKTDINGMIRVAIGSVMSYVSVYRQGSDEPWERVGENIIREGGMNSDLFGSSVSLSEDGNTVAIGALRANGERGLAYVYKDNGSNEWELKKEFSEATGTISQFGKSVSLSYDGTIVAVGAPDETMFGSSDPGHVFAYELA